MDCIALAHTQPREGSTARDREPPMPRKFPEAGTASEVTTPGSPAAVIIWQVGKGATTGAGHLANGRCPVALRASATVRNGPQHAAT
jgi:hypothetical protein